MMTHPFSLSAGPQNAERCAWYLRVSSPKQRLEHQREHVDRFCALTGIEVPTEFRFEDKEKRHKSAKRFAFQRLLDVVRAGRLDWIIICSFDRWGIADVDEFFEFRRILLQNDVQLWSVVDQMNLTGITEGDYFRIVAMAIGATKYVEQMAEKNILKMIEMAKQGWATTGNAPFGTDLVCYPLHDLSRPLFRVVRTRYMRPHGFRVIEYTPESRVERDHDGMIVARHLSVVKEDNSERMPLRDKKATGYRLEPSVEADRVRAVNLIYTLYDRGLGFREISRSLWDQGFRHYDKPFAYHGVETILGNSAYVGLPAWGKIGVGAYRILHGGGPVGIKRRSNDPFVVRKGDEQHVRPLQPVFRPMVPPDLWQRVHDRLRARSHTNPQFGKRRTRSRATHPLNGKLFCPDCDMPMVLGSSMPAIGGKGKKTRCFNCGTYRRFSRQQCHANTVGWDRLDVALGQLLDAVKGRIGRFKADPSKVLAEEQWAKRWELCKVSDMITREMKEAAKAGLVDPGYFQPSQTPDVPIMEQVFAFYNQMHARRSAGLKEELDGIERDLGRIAQDILQGVPSKTVRVQLNKRMVELEMRKSEIEPQLVPTTVRYEAISAQLEVIDKMIGEAGQLQIAQLVDTFVEKAIPRFDVRTVGTGKRRTTLRSVEFIPREAEPTGGIFSEAMEFGATRKDMGSSKRPG